MKAKTILGILALSVASGAMASDGPMLLSHGHRAQAQRIARAEMRQVNGRWVPVRVSDWVAVDNGVKPTVVTDSVFDIFEYSLDLDGNVVTDENGLYGASCGLADPAVRWTYTNQTRATMVYNDMVMAPNMAGTKAKRVSFAWQQGTTETLQVVVFGTENWVTTGDPNSSVARGDYPGVIIDFGTAIADPPQTYEWADVDISAFPIQLPFDGNGGYVLTFRTANNTAFSTMNCPAFWGTKAGNPSKSLDPFEYQSTTLNNGTFSLPADKKNLGFALCPDPLGSMALFMTNAPTIVVPTGQTSNFGALKTGNIASLAADDANPENWCKAFVPNFASPWLRTDITATSPVASPGFFRFSVKIRMTTAGTFVTNFFLFNYVAGGGTYTVSRTDPINLTFNTRDLYGTGTLSDFVRVGDNQIKSRMEVKQTGFSAVPVPCCSIEYANWAIGS